MMQLLSNWGGYPKRACNVSFPATYEEAIAVIRKHNSIIARGNGRCYGDASLAPNIIQTTLWNKIIDFNEKEGLLLCQSGILLSDILLQVVPKGFFLPVTPGTKYITIGGAFASDIHGKNHHIDGVFSDHVLYIRLMNASGEIVELRPDDQLFQQTAGGMGQTGIIVEVMVKLRRIETSFINLTSIRARNLSEIFSLFETHKEASYSVAWIDCLAKGNNLGRSVLLVGEHAKPAEVKHTNQLRVHKSDLLGLPFYVPSWFLNSIVVSLFNWFYYWKPGSASKNKIVHYDPYFYPLDAIKNWNRIYGKKGFLQYQFVVPNETSYETIKTVLTILADHKMGSFLAVLKLFGASHENRYLHFPMNGYTLALDIPVSEKIAEILDRLDDIVTKAGGKVYLTKDARMKKSQFEKQYRQVLPFTEKFNSFQMKRLSRDTKDVFLILGANSDIAKETASLFMKTYPDSFLILASRDTASLESWVSDQHWKEKTRILFFDAVDTASHPAFVDNLPFHPTWVLYASGKLIENVQATNNTNEWLDALKVNFSGAVSVLNILVGHEKGVELKRIMGISSVAGLRGRKANFMYGALKTGFHAYLFGLRQTLKDKHILVQAITPGFVRTKMTAHLPVPSNAVDASLLAKSIVLTGHKRFEVYPNTYWRIVGNMVKWLPESIIAKI